ncbi:MAG TPA: hypothetical protein VF843_16165 [Streptosporangiaceae bacterium]
MRDSRAQLGRALEKERELLPVEVVVFGDVDPPRRDLRDWADIRAWAVRLTRRPRARTASPNRNRWVESSGL